MTSSNGPNSLSARDRAALLHPMTDLVRHAEEGPLTIVRGEGIRVEDEEGRIYIEAVSGLWSVALGFGQKRLAEAAYQQLLELPSYHLFRQQEPSARHRTWRTPARACARADEQDLLRQFRLGGQRNGGQTRLVLQQRAEPASEESSAGPAGITASRSRRPA